MTDNLAELLFGDQQPRANPALHLIACGCNFLITSAAIGDSIFVVLGKR